MADIAMLVAEEYERRVKNSRRNGNGSGSEEEINLFSAVSVLLGRSGRVDDDGSSRIIVKKNFGEEEKKKMMEFFKWVVMEPKSQIAFAAINGSFSA